MGVALKQKPR